ncbi:hypothetical protein EES40_35135 [Streptomyces sp. ADI93-02]|nr:hypothetical protein EES40_35135 [Streptomyces sp. ADI93-02]
MTTSTAEKQPSGPALSGEPAPAPPPPRRSPDRNARLRRVGLRLLALVVLLALWQLVTSLRLWSPVLVPPPSAVWGTRSSRRPAPMTGYAATRATP